MFDSDLASQSFLSNSPVDRLAFIRGRGVTPIRSAVERIHTRSGGFLSTISRSALPSVEATSKRDSPAMFNRTNAILLPSGENATTLSTSHRFRAERGTRHLKRLHRRAANGHDLEPGRCSSDSGSPQQRLKVREWVRGGQR